MALDVMHYAAVNLIGTPVVQILPLMPFIVSKKKSRTLSMHLKTSPGKHITILIKTSYVTRDPFFLYPLIPALLQFVT